MILYYFAAAVAFLLAALILIKDRRSFANRCLAGGMALLGLMEAFAGVRPAFFAFAPGLLLMFSLSFGRAEYRKYLAMWKYIIVTSFVLPAAALLLPVYSQRIFYALILVFTVCILTNLERTLRASVGYIRWQIKFIVLGVACVCGSWIYISSQAMIYSELHPSLTVIHPVMLIVAGIFLAWGLARSQYLNVDVYLSRTTIQYSLTALLVSVYLVLLGIMAYVVRYFDPDRLLPIDALIVLLALAILAMLLLSDRTQERIKRFVTRHFKRPLHDYRKAWMELTERTNSLIDIDRICTVTARILSKTFNILSVNIWLCDDTKERLSLAGSTVFTAAQAADLHRSGESVSQLLRAAENSPAPLDLRAKPSVWAEDIMRSKPKYFAEYKMRTVVPLQTGGQLVGILTLNDDRVGNAPLSLEDHDLLNAYAAHLAARILQINLTENLRKAQEIQAFQHVSAFLAHDLKNVASRLSLTMQNLPAYFDNPEFREDALRLIRESVDKIDSTIERLSSLKQITIKPAPTDLNALTDSVLKDLERSTRSTIDRNFGQLPLLSIDPEQMQKVITNLVMNAFDAIDGKGRIRVGTSAHDRQAILTVTDDGCGMSKEFMDHMLFRPFSSTKKRGMGIGLFHCKMIVEAHQGRIEVDSEEGKGSTFKVVLKAATD